MLAGCHVDLSGLNQLFSSDPTYLSLPGKRIGSGKFSLVGIVGTNASGAHVIAFDEQTSPGSYAIFPFAGGTGCHTGPALYGYPSSLDFGVRSDVPPIIGFHERTSSTTLLHLATLDCKEPLAPIEDKNFPLDITFDSPPGYLAVETSGALVFLEPWNKKQRIVTDHARGTRLYQDKIWAIEDSTLVVRDMNLEVVARYGKNVTEFDTFRDSQVRVAYIEGTCAAGASPCEGDVSLITDIADEATKIDSNACNVVFPVAWGGRGVSYRSPCADKRLVVYGATKPSAGASSQSRIVVGDSVIGSPYVNFMNNAAYVFYAKSGPPGGTLMGGVLGGPLEAVGDSPTRDGSRGAPIVAQVGSAWRVTINVDDMTKAGRLVTWKPGEQVTEIATGIAQMSGSFAIVNFDGSLGDLVQVSGASVSGPLAHRVPAQHIIASDIGTALIADYNGTTGTLLVALPDTTDFEKVTKGVTLDELADGRIAFLQSLNAIGYLHDLDEKSGTGILGARILETGDTFDIGIRASEWGEYGWPEPGIMYVAPEGDAAGIWFARLK